MTHTDEDRATLLRLNELYIASYLRADVAWYDDRLAPDFVCIESDGTVLDKAQFLRDAAKGPDVVDYRLADVDVRIYGTTALVRARGDFTRPDGTKGTSRYVDVYVKQNGEWRTVSAQITRSAS